MREDKNDHRNFLACLEISTNNKLMIYSTAAVLSKLLAQKKSILTQGHIFEWPTDKRTYQHCYSTHPYILHACHRPKGLRTDPTTVTACWFVKLLITSTTLTDGLGPN